MWGGHEICVFFNSRNYSWKRFIFNNRECGEIKCLQSRLSVCISLTVKVLTQKVHFWYASTSSESSSQVRLYQGRRVKPSKSGPQQQTRSSSTADIVRACFITPFKLFLVSNESPYTTSYWLITYVPSLSVSELWCNLIYSLSTEEYLSTSLSLFNALILGNLCEYYDKSYISPN